MSIYIVFRRYWASTLATTTNLYSCVNMSLSGTQYYCNNAWPVQTVVSTIDHVRKRSLHCMVNIVDGVSFLEDWNLFCIIGDPTGVSFGIWSLSCASCPSVGQLHSWLGCRAPALSRIINIFVKILF